MWEDNEWYLYVQNDYSKTPKNPYASFPEQKVDGLYQEALMHIAKLWIEEWVELYRDGGGMECPYTYLCKKNTYQAFLSDKHTSLL